MTSAGLSRRDATTRSASDGALAAMNSRGAGRMTDNELLALFWKLLAVVLVALCICATSCDVAKLDIYTSRAGGADVLEGNGEGSHQGAG